MSTIRIAPLSFEPIVSKSAAYPLVLRCSQDLVVTDESGNSETYEVDFSKSTPYSELKLTPPQAEAFRKLMTEVIADADLRASIAKAGYITLPAKRQGKTATRGESFADLLAGLQPAETAAEPETDEPETDEPEAAEAVAEPASEPTSKRSRKG